MGAGEDGKVVLVARLFAFGVQCVARDYQRRQVRCTAAWTRDSARKCIGKAIVFRKGFSGRFLDDCEGWRDLVYVKLYVVSVCAVDVWKSR